MGIYLGSKSTNFYMGTTAISNIYLGLNVVSGGVTPITPPSNTVAPSISGTPTSGQTLTVSDGTWTGSPTFTRQWKADGTNISGQTGTTLLLNDALIGKLITVTVTATNGGGSTSATSNSVGPVASTIPFTSDSNTYFWDFIASDNGADTFGSTTMTFARERVGDKATVLNVNKAFQPLQVSGGITFNQATGRVLNFDLPATITNGKNGFYLAFVLTPTTATNGSIMSISGAASTTASRMWVDFTGSRNIRLRYGAADNTTLTTVFTSAAQLTLGQKYAIEILFDFDADTCTLWINGTNQNITPTGAPWSNYPSSNPREVLIGNNTTGTLSLDGVLNNIVFQDGVPSSGIRTSVSSFQQTRQAA